MTAAPYSFKPINRRVDWSTVLTLTDSTGALIDLTGAHFRMQIRDKVDGTLFLDISDTGVPARATMGGIAGTITIAITSADMVSFLPPASYTYDANLYQPSAETTLMAGSFPVYEGVTQ